MTTCIALVYPKFKIAVIGADGQITAGEKIVKLTAKKYVTKNNIGFAFAGSAMGGVAASLLFRECVGNNSEPEKAVLKFQDTIERFDNPVLVKNEAHGIIAWGQGLYLVSTHDIAMKSERLNNGALIESIGSGSAYAIGALTAMAHSIKITDLAAMSPEARGAYLSGLVTAAIQIAIDNDRNSGGTPSAEVLNG